MSATQEPTQNMSLLSMRVRTPQGVVYRSFVKETVILNLETGLYHGINPTGGRMLDALVNADSVRQAVSLLARDYNRPLTEIEADVCEFCEALADRGLILVEPV